MSEKENPVGAPAGAPTETQSSDVSRETVDLIEIMDRSLSKAPDPPEENKGAETPPQGETTPPPEEGTPPSPPGKNKPSSFYVYLVILFGAAFLMLLLAYFVQRRNNETAMTDLRNTMNLSREQLLEKIEELEEENAQLQKEVEYQKGRVTQVKEERENYRASFEYANARANDEAIHNYTLKYFWYITHFMENKEYPMAAAAILFQADSLRGTWNSQISVNPVQVEQYEAYRQELIDRGYLEERFIPSYYSSQSPTKLWFTETWDPSQSDDMAALCILWVALDAHFVKGADEAAAQYLCYYPLSNPESGYQNRVERLASKFTLEQFQLLKDELSESNWLVIAEDNTMEPGFGPNGSSTDVLYSLPFQLPEKHKS